jgi:hypothetical protein
MDIAHQFQQILILLAYDRLVTALKYMADLFVPQVKILAVGLLKTLHEFG